MATIHDVARIAGFSLGTVSNVINRPERVAPKTRQKIEQVMAELNYTPNAMARGLSLGQSRNLGVVLPNSHHPYFAHIVNGITDAAFPTGYRVTLLPTNYLEEFERQYLREFQQKMYAGMIFVSRQLPLTELESYVRYGQVVTCENVGDRQITSVYSDRTATYRAALRWIWTRGYRNVAILGLRGPEHSETTRDLLAAYEYVFHAPLSEARFRGGVATRQDGYAAAQFLATTDAQIDFVMANGDDIAAGVYAAYKELGGPMPGIMGTENQLSGQLLHLPTINHHLETLGHIAFNQAIRPGIRHQLVKSDFVAR